MIALTLRTLIVGGGIAGLTAGLELARRGHRVDIMERSPTRRSEGYMIDFFGAGYDVAEQLGLLPALEKIHYQIDHLLFVDAEGAVTADLPYPRIREAVFNGRHFNFLRADLERVLLDALPNSVNLLWGVSPDLIKGSGPVTLVTGSDGQESEYDLVIGADGVHSSVRAQVFGPGSTTITSLRARTASYVVDHYIPGLREDAFVSFSTAGMTAGAYPLRGGRMATFFIYRKDGPILERSARHCHNELEANFRGRGWRVDDLLDAFPKDGPVYFDEVVQIHLDSWSKGPVVLIGDACGCVSLLAGSGASLAMCGAFELAKQLERCPDIQVALKSYESSMRKVVMKAQRSGRRNASWFLPHSARMANMRNRVMEVALKTPLARLLGRSFGVHSRPAQ